MKAKYLTIISILFISCAPIPSYRYLCSETSGIITKNGAPVQNALVKRTNNSAWYNNHDVEITHTDSNGIFNFPNITRISLFYILHQPVISQKITIHHEGKEYLAWRFTKMNYDKNDEISRPLNLICSLENKDETHHLSEQISKSYMGICLQK